MSTAVQLVHGWERSPEAHTIRESVAEADYPMIWCWGRLLDLSEMPLLTQIHDGILYRLFRQPRPEYPDFCGFFATRAIARAQCQDPQDYIVGFEFGVDLGKRVAEHKTFCRPAHRDYAEQDARDALIYTDNLVDRLTEERRERDRRIYEAAERLRNTLRPAPYA